MQIFLIVFSAAVLFVFIEPMFEDVHNAATALGTAAGVFPLLLAVVWKKCPAAHVLAVIYFILAAITVCIMAAIWLCGKTNAQNERVIIVLGCSVKGSRPSLSLIHRVDAAYEFLNKNPSSVAILSGGRGKGEDISEAQCMKNMLLERGIDERRLIAEDKSTSTDENIRFSRELFDGGEAAIATSEYHQLRAKIICRKYGIRASAQSSSTKPTILPTFLLREIFAIIKACLKK